MLKQKGYEGIICDYCGAKRTKVAFMIGASLESDPEWTLWGVTTKMSCPKTECFDRGAEESRLAVKKATS